MRYVPTTKPTLIEDQAMSTNRSPQAGKLQMRQKRNRCTCKRNVTDAVPGQCGLLCIRQIGVVVYSHTLNRPLLHPKDGAAANAQPMPPGRSNCWTTSVRLLQPFQGLRPSKDSVPQQSNDVQPCHGAQSRMLPRWRCTVSCDQCSMGGRRRRRRRSRRRRRRRKTRRRRRRRRIRKRRRRRGLGRSRTREKRRRGARPVAKGSEGFPLT